MEIRWSYDHLISTMGFPILVRRHLNIESGPWTSWGSCSQCSLNQELHSSTNWSWDKMTAILLTADNILTCIFFFSNKMFEFRLYCICILLYIEFAGTATATITAKGCPIFKCVAVTWFIYALLVMSTHKHSRVKPKLWTFTMWKLKTKTLSER